MVKKRKVFQKNTKINKKISKKQIPQVDKHSTRALVRGKKIELRKEKELPVVTKINKGVDNKKTEVEKIKGVKTPSKCVFTNKSFLKLILIFLLGLIIGLSVSIFAINAEIEARKALISSTADITVNSKVIQRVQLFFEENLINETDELKLLQAEKVSGLYKMSFSINDNPVSLYATKDGEYIIFAEGIRNIDKWVKELNAAQEETKRRAEEESKCKKFQEELTPERKVKIAQCLAERGYKIYYADWCPFCVQQKELFGEAAKYLYGFDCYDPEGGRGNIAKCPDLLGVPAWRDRDGNQLKYNGEVIDGMIQIRRLVAISDCDF